MDRDSGAYFWYNTIDGSTQWADTDGSGTAGAAGEGPQPTAFGPSGNGDTDDEGDQGFGDGGGDFLTPEKQQSKKEERKEEVEETKGGGIPDEDATRSTSPLPVAEEKDGGQEGGGVESKEAADVDKEVEPSVKKLAQDDQDVGAAPASPRSLKVSQSTPDVLGATDEGNE